MLENMANRWQQAEINDVYAALQWMKNEHISQQKHKNHQQNSHFSNKSSKGSRHVEQMPEWMKNPVTDRNFQANTSKTSDSDMESENRLKDRLNNLIKKEES